MNSRNCAERRFTLSEGSKSMPPLLIRTMRRSISPFRRQGRKSLKVIATRRRAAHRKARPPPSSCRDHSTVRLLAQPVAKSLDLGAFERARRGGDVVGEVVGQRQREQADEAAGGEVGGGNRRIGEDDAVPGDRGIEREVAAAEAEPRRGRVG